MFLTFINYIQNYGQSSNMVIITMFMRSSTKKILLNYYNLPVLRFLQQKLNVLLWLIQLGHVNC
jgi:hypothetical protein